MLENATDNKEADSTQNKHYSGPGYPFLLFSVFMKLVFRSEVYFSQKCLVFRSEVAFRSEKLGISVRMVFPSKKQPQIVGNSSSSLKQQEV